MPFRARVERLAAMAWIGPQREPATARSQSRAQETECQQL